MLRYVFYLMPDATSELISNNALYDMGKQMAELKMYGCEGSLPMTFATIPNAVVKVLHITCPRRPAITVMELDDNGNVLRMEEVRPMKVQEPSSAVC